MGYGGGRILITDEANGTVTSIALTVPSILSVSGSPVTGSGTLAVTLATQTANTVFSGPTSGGAATPTFRALVDADIPNVMTTLGDTVYGAASGARTRLAGNTTATKNFLTQTGNGAASAAPAWGAIASADLPAITLTGDVTGTASGGSITTTYALTVPVNRGGTGITSGTSGGVLAFTAAGTIASSGALAQNGIVLGGGAGVAPTSLATNSSTAFALISGGTNTAPSWGTLQLGGGGTGATTKAGAFDALSPMTTGGDIIYGGASGTGTRLANGTSGYVLTSAGGTSAPTWAPASVVETFAAKTADYTLTTSDNNITVDDSGGNVTITLPTAVGNTRTYHIKKISDVAFQTSIATTSSQTIDGRATTEVKLYTKGDYLEVYSNNANWIIKSKQETQYANAKGDYAYSDGGTDGDYGAVTGNSVALTYGVWELTGDFMIQIGTGNSIMLYQGSGFYAANGDNGGSAPTDLSTQYYDNTWGDYPVAIQWIGTLASGKLPAVRHQIVVGLTSTTTIYLVPRIGFSSAGTAAVTCSIRARRIW